MNAFMGIMYVPPSYTLARYAAVRTNYCSHSALVSVTICVCIPTANSPQTVTLLGPSLETLLLKQINGARFIFTQG